MKRRAFITGLACAGLVFPQEALAQDAQTRVIQRLQRDGYRNIRISRTFLGRIRIIARGAAGEREIILNPSTGAILRDVLRQSGSGEGSRDDDRSGSSEGPGSDNDDDNDQESDDDQDGQDGPDDDDDDGGDDDGDDNGGDDDDGGNDDNGDDDDDDDD